MMPRPEEAHSSCADVRDTLCREALLLLLPYLAEVCCGEQVKTTIFITKTRKKRSFVSNILENGIDPKSDSYPGARWQCLETVLVIPAGGEGRHYWHLVGRGQDKHPTMPSTALTSKNDLGQNVSSVPTP